MVQEVWGQIRGMSHGTERKNFYHIQRMYQEKKVTQRIVQEQLNVEKKLRPVTGKVAMEQGRGLLLL